MVNDLRELMREASAGPPHDDADLRAVLATGRRRVRVRRAALVGGTALAAGAITLGSLTVMDTTPPDLAAAGVPGASGPTIDLSGARPAVEGTDYRELATHTNDDLDAGNGQYFDGVTDDGLVLFRDGPHGTDNTVRYALLDPATGEQDQLEGLPSEGHQFWPVELSEERLVVMRLEQVGQSGMRSRPVLEVFDRSARTWSTVSWPTLPASEGLDMVQIGPDGRAYAAVTVDPGDVPEGGWPMGPDGEADDAGAEGDVHALWSMSLTDPTDVRDEGLRVGAFAFDGDRLVWTDRSNGSAGLVHVRDLATGEDTSFDPQLGERCNLLGLDAAGGRIAMTQYCGTYEGGVRDDRVQVVTTEGDPVVTVQDSGVDGGQLVAGGDALTMVSYGSANGTYVYDLDDGRLLRLGEGMSSWATATGPAPGDLVLWTTPAGGGSEMFGRSGATAHLGELLGG